MAKKFSELREKMSPEARARSDAKTRQLIAEMKIVNFGALDEREPAGH